MANSELFADKILMPKRTFSQAERHFRVVAKGDLRALGPLTAKKRFSKQGWDQFIEKQK
jgi:hypothetical protein